MTSEQVQGLPVDLLAGEYHKNVSKRVSYGKRTEQMQKDTLKMSEVFVLFKYLKNPNKNDESKFRGLCIGIHAQFEMQR